MKEEYENKSKKFAGRLSCITYMIEYSGSLFYTHNSMDGIIRVAVLTFLALVCYSLIRLYVRRCTEEGFSSNTNKKVRKVCRTPNQIYDSFYAKLYDKLFGSKGRDVFTQSEIHLKTIQDKYEPKDVHILDIGCGTGGHVRAFAKKGYHVIGLDNSKAMVNYCQGKPKCPSIEQGDMHHRTQFEPGSFTHVTCLYFTLQYSPTPKKVFSNVYDWLEKDGWFIVHIVDPKRVDPLIEASSPFPAFSAQSFSKQRITSSKVVFKGAKYQGTFKYLPNDDKCTFTETITWDKKPRTRKHIHTLYTKPLDYYKELGKEVGFTLKHIVDLTACQYEYQYLYMFQKKV